MSAPKNKEKRIDKELFLLRNLPKDYKLGKKETQLGTLLDVSISIISLHEFIQIQLEIARSAVKSQFLDKTVERFYFDILLRDKYPFQPPIIMTRTTVRYLLQLFYQNLFLLFSFAIHLWLTEETCCIISFQSNCLKIETKMMRNNLRKVTRQSGSLL